MTPDEARHILQDAVGCEDPLYLPPAVLKHLTIGDLPPDVEVEIGVQKDKYVEIQWEGVLLNKNGQVQAESRRIWTRKYWNSPLGMEQFMDLIRRAVEVRSAQRGDVKFVHWDDDGAFIQFTYSIDTGETNLGQGYTRALEICNEIDETAEDTANKVGVMVSSVAQRVSGWGAKSFDELLNGVDKAQSSDERGRALEELMCRLFESVKGLTVSDRVRTATEEIDIVIVNGSSEPRLRRESAIILAECKNWSGKCGKDEVVIFQQKIENRSKRCNLGFLVSWNSFTKTVTKELLRGAREESLIVPITGAQIRAAVRDENFHDVVMDAWDKAVTL